MLKGYWSGTIPASGGLGRGLPPVGECSGGLNRASLGGFEVRLAYAPSPAALTAFLPLDPATRTPTVARAAAAYPNVNYTTASPTRATAGAKIAAATGATARTIIATPAAVPISLSSSFDPHASGSDRNALSRTS